MLHSRGPGGTVEIDGFKYDWELQSEPQQSSADGWKGMTVSLRQKDMPREAVLEFPTPKRLLKGLPKGRSHINDAIASKGVRAALSAGWDPASRGKTMVFMVDANGD
ncbi:hypothetical protein G4G27_13895 [Sphingomonas sp. So64.6b]|uniref:hypothetical protein n=1 Tax=Sphingomonas sp. So64.6b TaxID=2997354 RepID=UPI0015FFE407|nr:hypothetical protein [Sphingomonas sp. So64.6b]QNA84966.1 hypothetical protein G4G27_13895 [Sphingomonas sp. So64.6b]